MKKSYVAFFPEIAKDHWLNTFRSEYDEKSKLVPPHMTLVFPTDTISSDDLTNVVSRLAETFPKFNVCFRAAMVMPEKSSDGYTGYVFLVPDEGFGNVLRLHDRLYSDRLMPALRLDIPFVPHITIGSNMNLATAKEQVDQLNSTPFDLNFLVDRISVVEIADPTADRILKTSVALKGPVKP